MKAIAALALAVPLLLPAVAGADPTSLSYRNQKLHYAISYPATWTTKSLPRVTGADFALMSADHNAFLSISVSNGVVTAKNQVHTVKYSFSAFGRAVTTPEIHQVQVPGSTGTLGTATVTSGAGKLSTVYVFLATYQLRNYTAIGVVRDVNAKVDEAALLLMILSMTFFS